MSNPSIPVGPGTPAGVRAGNPPNRPPNSPPNSPHAGTAAAPSRRVSDAPTRLFHALFGLSFLGAYLTGDSEHWRALHVTLGYAMAGLLVFRLAYGLLGPRQVRLSGLARRVSGARDIWHGLLGRGGTAPAPARPWRQGQNLLLAMTVVLMLAMVVPLVLSGYATHNEWASGEWLAEVHEFFGQAFLALVLLHVGGLLALSLLRRSNLALPMLSGRVKGAGPDLAKQNHVWLAGLLLLAVLALGVWQWRQSPEGLWPAGSGWLVRDSAHGSAEDEHDD